MIWRRVQVSADSSFFDLHHVIQDAMGWDNCHLYEFRLGNVRSNDFIRIGPQDDYLEEVLPSDKVTVKDYLSESSEQCSYLYDFGDDWEHKIVLEKVLMADASVNYPVCLAGKRACPPEDCGGVYGYGDLLTIMADPEHEEYDEMVDWLGDEFDPEEFDVSSVVFK